MVVVYNSPHTRCSENQSDNFLPVGSYHRLLALLQSSTYWKLCVNDRLAYSNASLEVKFGMRVVLTLLKHICVTVWYGIAAFKEKALQMLPNIREDINKASKKLGLPIHEKFLIMCPHQEVSKDPNDICMVPVAVTETSLVPQINVCV